jgi:hypothetical protein
MRRLLLTAALMLRIVTIVWSQGVQPIAANDPQLAVWKTFAKAHRLKWEINLGPTGDIYCLEAERGHAYYVSCHSNLRRAVADVIADFKQVDKCSASGECKLVPLAQGSENHESNK